MIRLGRENVNTNIVEPSNVRIDKITNGLNRFIIRGVINKLIPKVNKPTIKLTVPSFKDPYPESAK